MLVEIVLWGALAVLLYLSFFKKPPGLPPGPWGVPLFGHIPWMKGGLEKYVTDLRTKYGDIYLWRIGTHSVVFLHDHQLIKEAFNRPEMQDRPHWDSLKLREAEPKGIVSSNGIRWQNLRRFTLRQLRDLGMGKSKMVGAMHKQATMLVDEFKKDAGTITGMPYALTVAVVNIIWQMVGGQQFSLTDPKLKEFEDIVDTLMTSLGRVVIADLMPWIQNVLPNSIMIRLFMLNHIDHMKDRFLDFFNDEIKQHRETLDPNNPRDLIDAYLIESDNTKDDPETTFNEHELPFLILDLFTAGSETTATTLNWMIYYLASHPHVQRKMQHEIDGVLPKGILPTLEDKPKLPYVEAVIHETLRMSSLSTFGVQHLVTRDTTLGGYTIKKGMIVSSANTSVHFSPQYWNEPNKFFPERWIDDDGKLNSKKEGFLPFSLGKRQCAGEALARMELFIFSITLLQSLSFNEIPGKKLNLNSETWNPILHVPIPQDIIVSIRD